MKDKKEKVTSNEEKFISSFHIQRTLQPSEIEELFSQRPGDGEIRLGIEVPKRTENASYYLNEEGFALIKSEPYDVLEQEEIKHLLEFCEKKKWKLSIHQGFETHSPGRTLTVVYTTDFKPKLRSQVRRKRTTEK